MDCRENSRAILDVVRHKDSILILTSHYVIPLLGHNMLCRIVNENVRLFEKKKPWRIGRIFTRRIT